MPPGRLLLAIALLVIAFNMRPVFASLSPVLPELMATLGITPASASLLTTGPVLCLGIFALAAPGLAVRVGTERTLLAALLALSTGTALRGIASFPAVVAGSLLAGIGIAVVNVLLPSLVKRDFADRAALMTGSYSMVMCAGAALAAGVTVPLSRVVDGAGAALAAWSLPALAAALVWAAVGLRRAPASRPVGEVVSAGRLWRERLAWDVALFMGSQSALAYCVFGWMAPILRERGADPVTAGLLVSVSILVQAPASFLAPQIAARFADVRPFAVLLIALAAGGLLGVILAPLPTAWLWVVLQGLGQGALFSMTMTFIIQRSPDARTVASLSGMAQGVGYALAGSGPLFVGLIRDRAGSFGPAAYLVGSITAVAVLAAFGAGRNRLLPSVVRPAA